MSDTLLDTLNGLKRCRLLVVGDVMLDRDVRGEAERISPEAPVIVLRADDEEVRLGGAGGVAAFARALSAEVCLAGVVGDDAGATTVRSLCRDDGIDVSRVLVDPLRTTTQKERFIGLAAGRHGQQMLRVDRESRCPLSDQLETELIGCILTTLPDCDAVLIADYAKGVCTRRLVAAVIRTAREQHPPIPILVDPGRGRAADHYRGATLLKPNRQEAAHLSGMAITDPAQAIAAAEQIRAAASVEHVVVTLDRDGCIVVSRDGPPLHVPTDAREVYDITGAGDMFLAWLGLAVGNGLPLERAVRLANAAAGLEVEREGSIPVTREELQRSFAAREKSLVSDSRLPPLAPALRGEGPGVRGSSLPPLAPALRGEGPGVRGSSLPPLAPALRGEGPGVRGSCLGSTNNNTNHFTPNKLTTLEDLAPRVVEYRQQSRRIVFTNGCFDLLHAGHVSLLEEAARHGDILIVALNSDASVRKLKGPDRPVVSQTDRARMLAALACVDHVLIFDDDTPHRLLHTLKPDLLIKGGTTNHIVGQELVEAYGGQVLRADAVPGISTTKLLQRLSARRESVSP